MAGISSKSAGKLENRYKYNGIELNEDLGVVIELNYPAEEKAALDAKAA